MKNTLSTTSIVSINILLKTFLVASLGNFKVYGSSIDLITSKRNKITRTTCPTTPNTQNQVQALLSYSGNRGLQVGEPSSLKLSKVPNTSPDQLDLPPNKQLSRKLNLETVCNMYRNIYIYIPLNSWPTRIWALPYKFDQLFYNALCNQQTILCLSGWSRDHLYLCTFTRTPTAPSSIRPLCTDCHSLCKEISVRMYTL